MKKLSLSFMLLIAAWSFQACNNGATKTDSVETAKETNEDNKNVKEDDSEFMVEAANGGMMEVEAGKVAASKAQNAKVKEFGNMMVTDHSKANEELKALAATKNIAIPATLGADEQKHVNDLSQKAAADFDKDYMDMMVDDHEKDVKKFEDAANNAKDPDVKAWAAKTLPVLQKHLETSKSTRDALKK